MDPATLAAIGGAVLGIGTAAFSEWWSKADKQKRDALLEQAHQIYANMSPPEIADLRAEQVGPSAFEDIASDFGNKEARNRALQEIINMGLQGGNDAGSVLAMEEARRAAAALEQQGRGAVRQEFARRGIRGAGEASLQQQAQQAAAGNAALADLQSAASSRMRALQALAEGGQMAQGAESADWQQAAARAGAMDRFQEFNARVRQDTNQFNAGLKQQQFQNQLGLADRLYGATRARAGDYETEAERKRRIAGGVGQAASGGLNTFGQNYGGG
jgi:hypothetical protein